MLDCIKDIKNVVFDFGGVLIDLDRQCCVDNFRHLGWTGFETELGISLKQGFLQKFELGLILPSDFRDGVRKAIGTEVSDEDIDACWNSFLVGVPQSKLDMLIRLRRRFNVYLLSNTNAIHWEWSVGNVFGQDGHSVDDYFDGVFLSFAIHSAKPDTRIFRHVIDSTGIKPEETLFIDDLQQNCDTAAAMKFNTYKAEAHEDLQHLF